MQFTEPQTNRWRTLFLDAQGRVLGTSRPLASQMEAQRAAEQGMRSFPGTVSVEIVYVRRKAEPKSRAASSLIIP